MSLSDLCLYLTNHSGFIFINDFYSRSRGLRFGIPASYSQGLEFKSCPTNCIYSPSVLCFHFIPGGQSTDLILSYSLTSELLPASLNNPLITFIIMKQWIYSNINFTGKMTINIFTDTHRTNICFHIQYVFWVFFFVTRRQKHEAGHLYWIFHSVYRVCLFSWTGVVPGSEALQLPSPASPSAIIVSPESLSHQSSPARRVMEKVPSRPGSSRQGKYSPSVG